MITAKLTQKNPGWLDKLKKRYQQKSEECAVGYPMNAENLGTPHYPTAQSAVSRNHTKLKKKNENLPELKLGGGPSIIDVAIWNNYGPNARPFMSLASKNMQPKFQKMMQDAVKRINKGELTFKVVLKAAGEMGKTEVRKAIRDGSWRPNSPEWTKFKGDNTPLRDSGDMLRAVTYVVRPAQ